MTRIIKKYPNRRLYDTQTSAYITLAEIKQFVLDYLDFQVQDARTGEDLTRSILLQIILEEESGGVPMFTSDMLGNIIRYYGHSMQGLMGSYLERSIGAFHDAQRKFQAQASTIVSSTLPPADAVQHFVKAAGSAVPNVMGDYLEKSASSVIGMQEELRKNAMQMFSGFPAGFPSNFPANFPYSPIVTNPADATQTKAAKKTHQAKSAKPATAAKTKKPSSKK